MQCKYEQRAENRLTFAMFLEISYLLSTFLIRTEDLDMCKSSLVRLVVKGRED